MGPPGKDASLEGKKISPFQSVKIAVKGLTPASGAASLLSPKDEGNMQKRAKPKYLFRSRAREGHLELFPWEHLIRKHHCSSQFFVCLLFLRILLTEKTKKKLPL